MPKLKTHKASKRRFKVTATGKLKFRREGRRHLNAHMSGNAKRKLDTCVTINTTEAKKIVKAITEGNH
ncbi:MAG TPA: 50S ribosomal protein L35 [Gemmatales bacterium]|nr:50S ribosomal protein L35 [Gemmatales bacterium]HMP15502.1 50S ribosomal protein L35 [Gemmatales bacterium]